MLPRYFGGIWILTVEGSVGSAVSAPMKSLIAAAMRCAVVKSGLRSDRRSTFLHVQPELDLALDQRPVGDAPHGGNAARHLGGVALGLEPGDGNASPARRHRPRRRRRGGA